MVVDIKMDVFSCSYAGCTRTFSSKKVLWQHNYRVHKRALRGGRRLKDVANDLFHNAQVRARKKGGSVTITNKWITDILKLGRCQGSMPPLEFEILRASGPFSPSLDRIDSRNCDYTPENTRVVCWCINAMRNNFSDSVVSTSANSLARFMNRRRNSI